MSCDIEIRKSYFLTNAHMFLTNEVYMEFQWRNLPKNSFGRWLMEVMIDPDLYKSMNDISLFKEITEDFPVKLPYVQFMKTKDDIIRYVERYKSETKKLVNHVYKRRGIKCNAIYLLKKFSKIDFNKPLSDIIPLVIKYSHIINEEMTLSYTPIVENIIIKGGNYMKDYNIPDNNKNYERMVLECKGDKCKISYLSENRDYNHKGLNICEMPKNVYEDLRNKYLNVNDTENEILKAIWKVYKRYHSFVETDTSSSLQSAVPEIIFKYLNDKYVLDAECFASPFNSFMNKYCSAFIDTDEAFGSLGSFFNFYPKTGFYEANPPFTEFIMYKMATHIEFLLNESDEPLTFVVFVPRWDDAESIIFMDNSPYLTYKLKLKKNEHSYTNKKQKFNAVHDSYVYFLQNNSGKIAYPISLNEIEEIKILYLN